jgi:soluble cytochrome b562
MSAISSVTSTGNPYQATNQAGMGQIIQDFNSIGSALQSGNVSAAQTALTTFQQDLQSNPQLSSSQPFGNNSQANTDYQGLVSSLQNGNLSSAQKAFASLQTDLQASQTSTKTAHRGGHRHHGSGGASTASLINSLSINSSTTSGTSTSLTTGTTTATGTGIGGTTDRSLLNATA